MARDVPAEGLQIFMIPVRVDHQIDSVINVAERFCLSNICNLDLWHMVGLLIILFSGHFVVRLVC